MRNCSSKNLGAACAVAVLLTACGGGGDSPAADGSTTTDATASAVPAADAVAPPLDRAIAAARQAAATDPDCAPEKMGDFYWEIGNATGSTPIVSNSEGGGTVTASSRFAIASASKFLFGAYVLEKKGIDQVRSNPALFNGLRFLSGYTGFDETACSGTATAGECFAVGGATTADPKTTGLFDYDGGHDQKLAAQDLGMYDYTARQISQEYQATLGLPASMFMTPLDPILAGGMQSDATDYAQFLRKVMNQQLVIGAHLGEDAVCADPFTCPAQVAYSPAEALGEPWSYSYNYWVESEHGNGTVDAYSSAGKFGFYPWITPNRKYYGIVSRHDTTPTAAAVSVLCGRQIRKAFLGALPAAS